MRDDLMTGFLKETSDHSFANWRPWCIDHAERPGSFSEFTGRIERVRQALQRRKGSVSS